MPFRGATWLVLNWPRWPFKGSWEAKIEASNDKRYNLGDMVSDNEKRDWGGLIYLLIIIILSVSLGYSISKSELIERYPSSGNYNDNFTAYSVEVEDLTIHFDTEENINKKWNDIKTVNGTWENVTKVLAFALPNSREIYVPLTDEKDINGKYLPNLELLGHELYHMNELGGHWHE